MKDSYVHTSTFSVQLARYNFKVSHSRHVCNRDQRCSIHNTYLLTPWCRVLLEKLTGLQLVKKFPAFHGTRRFITALTSVRHLSLIIHRHLYSRDVDTKCHTPGTGNSFRYRLQIQTNNFCARSPCCFFFLHSKKTLSRTAYSAGTFTFTFTTVINKPPPVEFMVCGPWEFQRTCDFTPQ